jgi:aspartyl-tRNA(Asn)/glutamyl-tRNA(Gln) amidotransferase subunit C
VYYCCPTWVAGNDSLWGSPVSRNTIDGLEFTVSLSKEQVQHIALLARLSLDEKDIDDVVEKLSSIVDFVDQLQAAPTDDVVPMAHPMDMSQRLRADAVTESNERDKFQQNAPSVQDGLYLVPKVLE